MISDEEMAPQPPQQLSKKAQRKKKKDDDEDAIARELEQLTLEVSSLPVTNGTVKQAASKVTIYF